MQMIPKGWVCYI